MEAHKNTAMIVILYATRWDLQNNTETNMWSTDSFYIPQHPEHLWLLDACVL